MPTSKKSVAKPAKATAKAKKPAVTKAAKAVTKSSTKKAVSKRELIKPHKGDKRYVRRKGDGTFGHTVDVGKSLSADSRSKAKTKVAKGQGDRGDTRR